jgi:hypothetical protein
MQLPHILPQQKLVFTNNGQISLIEAFHNMNKSLHDFVTRVSDAARSLKIDISHRAELTGAEFRGGSGEPALKGAHLPLETATLSIGRFSILFGSLAVTPDITMVRDGIRRYRNQCVLARSHLAPDKALDLQLWLIGPDGSGNDPAWNAMGLAIERDDRVARKLVWLPPIDASLHDLAFKNFLARTFLARPWLTLPKKSSAQLDRLSSLSALVSDLRIEGEILDKWLDLAGSELSDGTQLVDALVNAWVQEKP